MNIKFFGYIFFIWIVLYLVRVLMIGGLDPDYRQEKAEPISLQQYLSQISTDIIPAPESSLISGIVLGDGSKIPYGLKLDLQTTSTIHIVVVSGQNLTILAGFIMSLVGVLGRKRAIILTLVSVVGYCILTGLQIPVIRAGIMAVVSLVGQSLGREVHGWWLLFVTAGLMLLYNPNWLMSISFQLSFLATFGVIVVAPILIQTFKSFPEIFREDFAVTLAAQLLTLPVIAYNFNQLSIVGLLVNILIGWSIPLIMILGALVLLIGTLSTELAQILAIFPVILLRYFIYLVRFFSDLPLASIYIPTTNFFVWVGYYLIITGVLLHLRMKKILNSLR